MPAATGIFLISCPGTRHSGRGAHAAKDPRGATLAIKAMELASAMVETVWH
jgi:hypothetical protein